MDISEIVARTSIWVALAFYIAGEFQRLRWRADPRSPVCLARLLSTLGCGCYCAHVATSFAIFHGWSHGAALQFTEEQTEAFTGLRSGAGIYVNYLFSTIWIVETIAWWSTPDRYRERARWIDLCVRVFFVFMIANGAAIFVTSPRRWLGVVMTAILLAALRKYRR